MEEIVGYSPHELGGALSVMEAELGDGQSARVTICTESLPTPAQVAELYLGMVATGSHVSYPAARVVDGIPTTEFIITKGSPVFLAILPVLVPLFTIGVIAWGIAKVENISKALIPIVLISLGGIIVLAAVLRQPATKYLERGGKIPFLPDARKPTRNDVSVESWKERDRLGIWLKDKHTGKTIAEWWDDEARQMFEDGLFKRGVPTRSGEKPGWEFEESVLDYAEDMGMLAGRRRMALPKKSTGRQVRAGRYLAATRSLTDTGEKVPGEYWDLLGFIDEPLPDFSLSTVPEGEERKIDVVMRQLKAGVEGIQDSSQFRLFLTTMSKFHNYSIGNLILIAIQKPGATHVAGFATWKDLGRWVKKAEKGIAILAPVMPPKPKEEEKKEGAEEAEIGLAPVYFRVVHVFDISQTEGKELPAFDVPVLTGEANEELFTKLLAMMKERNVDITFEPRPSQDPGIKGMYSGASIWVRPEEARAQQLKTLIHEIAHYYSEDVFRILRHDAETIAESAAYVIGAHWGFDTGTRSFPYVALWAQDKKVLQQNLNSIRKVASTILESLEGKETHGVLAATHEYGIWGAWIFEVPPDTCEAVVLALVVMGQLPPPKEEGWKLVHIQPGKFTSVEEAKEWLPDKPGKYFVGIGTGTGWKWELATVKEAAPQTIKEEDGRPKWKQYTKLDKPPLPAFRETFGLVPKNEMGAMQMVSPKYQTRMFDDAPGIDEKPQQMFVWDKGTYPAFEYFMDGLLAGWARKMGVQDAEFIITDYDGIFYSAKNQIVLPWKLARAYTHKKKDFPGLVFFIAHEFAHWVAEQKGLDFSEAMGEERYANKAAEELSGVMWEDALVSLYSVLPMVWAKTCGRRSLDEAIKKVKEAKSKGNYLARTQYIQEGKVLPALKPFEPYHFAEYVLRYNRFSEAEIPIYSGLTGRAPLRVPDHVWSEVIAALDGEFVKQGEIYVFHAPEKERPSYMRAAPTWRDVADTSPATYGSTEVYLQRSIQEEAEAQREYLKRGVMAIRAGDPKTSELFQQVASEEKHHGEEFEKRLSQVRKDEFVSCSAEYLAYTIDDIGYRQKFDEAFQSAIARAREG